MTPGHAPTQERPAKDAGARHPRWFAAVVCATVLATAGCAAAPAKDPGDPVTSVAASPDESALKTATPGHDDTAGGTSKDGDEYLIWSRNLSDVLPGENPWLSQLVAAGDSWLMRVITDGPSPDTGVSFMVPIKAETGLAAAPVPKGALPEDAYCAQHLLEAMVACAWGDAIRLMDPATGEPTATPFARTPGLEIFGLEVMDTHIVAVGLSGSIPTVAAFGLDGTLRWRTGVEVQGCSVERPEYSATVDLTGREIRAALGANQFVLDPADGTVLARACGLAAHAPSGAMAVAREGGNEDGQPTTYVGADGSVHPIIDVGPALQVVAVNADGAEFFAVVGDGDELRLVDARSGTELWNREWQYGRVQASDDQRIYLSGRHGLSGVSLTTGEVLWTWSGDPGMAVRTATLTAEGGLVALTSSGVRGISPQSGDELWTVADRNLAGWYWLPEEGSHGSGAIALLGVDRDSIARLDAPRMR